MKLSELITLLTEIIEILKKKRKKDANLNKYVA